MAKAALKRSVAIEQGGVDPLNGATLADDQSLNDIDRVTPKAKGGTYRDRKNVRVLEPRSHMNRHGILRQRATSLDDLKSVFDDRVQVMKLQLKINNQLLAYERRVDHRHPETSAFLTAQLAPIQQRLGDIDKALAKALKSYPDPLSEAALKVKGLGPVTVAALAVYVDFQKQICILCRKPRDGSEEYGCRCGDSPALVYAAATPSALWKYVGLHAASHERYVKGEAGGGNKTLRTVLYNAACAMMKMGGPYRDVYDRTKLRLSASEKVTKSRNTQGKLIEVPWRETKPSHRHGAALRAVMKHLLADYWLVGRTLAGLPTVPLYAQAQLGHTHIVSPKERGWTF